MSIEINNIVHLLKVRYALDISMFESSFLEKVIRSRMVVLGEQISKDYTLFLNNETSESTALYELLSNSYSEFFRNPITFAYLERIVLPSIINRKVRNQENEIRIWSAACAAGQEAYSLAILCDEILARLKSKLTCLIFGTDKNENELIKAEDGIFHRTSLNNVTLKRIQSYFTKHKGNFIINPLLREYVDFSVFDLLTEQNLCPPSSIYGNFDLIFCSNIFFYYTMEHRQRMLSRIGSCMAPHGFLITGEVERDFVKDIYKEVFPHSGIFNKVAGT